MEKETVEAYLEIRNNEPIVIFKGIEGYTNPETLVDFLLDSVTSKKLKACIPREEKGYTSYRFKSYKEETKMKEYFVVKVRNKDRYLHKSTLEAIKNITGVSSLIKKFNVTRFVAGLAISLTILTIAGPTMAKGLDKLLEKDYQYDQQRYKQYSYSSTYEPTVEDRKQAEKQYHEDLIKRAENGDEAAQQEYEEYLIEQSLKGKYK